MKFSRKSSESPHGIPYYWEAPNTLIRIGKFGEITVLIEKKNVILTQTHVISTQWTLKRHKKLLKAKFEGQRPKNSNFMIFSVIWVSLQTIVQKNSLV